MTINLVGPINSGLAVGGDGVATANNTSDHIISGRIIALDIKYNATPPGATTDVTIATAGNASPAVTITTITDSATAKRYYPRDTVHDKVGADLTYDGTHLVSESIPINDNIKITIAGANADDNADVYLLMEN